MIGSAAVGGSYLTGSLDLDPDLGEDALFDDRVLGGGDFAERILKLSDQLAAEKKCSMADLIDLVASHFAIEPRRRF